MAQKGAAGSSTMACVKTMKTSPVPSTDWVHSDNQLTLLIQWQEKSRRFLRQASTNKDSFNRFRFEDFSNLGHSNVINGLVLLLSQISPSNVKVFL